MTIVALAKFLAMTKGVFFSLSFSLTPRAKTSSHSGAREEEEGSHNYENEVNCSGLWPERQTDP